MKNTIQLIFLSLALLLVSCVDLTEEMITDTVADVQFSTAQGLDEALIGAYVPFRWYYGRENGMLMTLYGTDLFREGQSYNGSWDRYDAGLNPATTLATQSQPIIWEYFYQGINYANTVISRADQINDLNANTRNAKVAEAKFLRAHYYFILVQHFGGVHLALEETREVELEAFRATEEEVYSQILSDLDFAVNNLPEEQSQYGRPTRDAARHHLAKVHLTIGNWQQAADYAREVINGGRHALLDNYEDVFDPFNQRHAEVIWSIQWGDNPEVNNPVNELQRFFAPRQWLLPGLVGDNMYHTGIARFWPTDYLLIDVFGNDYRSMDLNIKNDVRYHVTFKEAWLYNDEATLPEGKSIGDTAAWFTSDPYIQEMSDEEIANMPYLVVRIKDINRIYAPTVQKHRYPFQRGHGRDFMVMRLAETYLIAAEALMQLGNMGEAANYFNVVRKRAEAPGHTIPLVDPSELNIDLILDERARELAGELHRWKDLKRTGKLLERVRTHNPNAAPNIQEHHLLRPIPQVQIDRTRNDYPQNPGY
ncbi:MAG: RagB/SusD family nutrient uptake outer membrane protein [Saprospirales bacterium]|nr:MAG: RagB/SusD family nutrient uptake outer membrane protein [Saprospirales bacterium]